MPRWVDAGREAESDSDSDSSGSEESSDEEDTPPQGVPGGQPAAGGSSSGSSSSSSSGGGSSSSSSGSSDESSSDEDSSEGEEAQPAQQAQPAQPQAPASGSTPAKGAKAKLSISLGGLVCHVCGKKGHNAGFVGSVYIDCPNRPCYLCKQPGHTTMTCPHRAGPDHDLKGSAAARSGGLLAAVLQTPLDGRRRVVWRPTLSWQIDSALLKVHARRCTCLQFHPSRHHLVLSGDKQGQVAVWDFETVHERTVWRPFRALTNTLAFLRDGDGLACFAASSDGSLKALDLETGLDSTVLDLNPGGWVPGVSNERNWVMLHGLDCCAAHGLLAAGDSQGRVHFLDPRTQRPTGTHQLHKKGNKVNSVQFNPVDEDLMVTGSNDWTARLFDLRRLTDAAALPDAASGSQAAAPMELARIDHPKVVNSAYFSPRSGRKLLTTCIDNRLRVWDTLLTADRPPDREIVHSHDFNRYLTPFRAEWDPKDPAERLVVIGRYISENFSGTALHPIDLFDAGSGALLQQLRCPNLQTICPVNKCHPHLDVIVTGSSRSLYAWRPTPPDEEEGGRGRASAASSARAQAAGVQAWEHGLFFDASGEPGKKRKGGAEAAAEEEDDDGPPSKAKAKVKPKKAGSPQPRRKKDNASEKGSKQE